MFINMLYRNGKLSSSPLQAMFDDFVLTPSAYLQNFVCNFSIIKESVSFEIYLLICFSHLLAGK